MTRSARRVADYAPSTLERSADLVLAAAVEEAVRILRAPRPNFGLVEFVLWKATGTAQLILDRSAS